MNISLTKQVLWRFVIAGFAGAFSTIGAVTYYTGIHTWEDLQMATGVLALSIVIGFLNGVIMAIHKYFTGATMSVDSTLVE